MVDASEHGDILASDIGEKRNGFTTPESRGVSPLFGLHQVQYKACVDSSFGQIINCIMAYEGSHEQSVSSQQSSAAQALGATSGANDK